MDTTGESILSIVGDIVVLALFVQIAIRTLPRPDHPPIFTIVLTALIGVPSLLQPIFPSVTESFARRPQLTLEDGEWWRPLTALVAQDGGLAAAIFNLFVVVGVLLCGEWIWGPALAATIFVGSSVVLNLLALAWNAPGGGSSFASDGLLMSVCGLALVRALQRRRTGGGAQAVRSGVPDWIVIGCALATVVVAIVLVAADDAHGLAMLLGFGVAVPLALFSAPGVTRRSRVPRSAP